jgi:hypothetical protein
MTASYLRVQGHVSAANHRRFVYAEVIASLGFILSLLFLFRWPKPFVHFPMDFALFVLFITAFGLIANVLPPYYPSSGQNVDEIVHLFPELWGHLGLALYYGKYSLSEAKNRRSLLLPLRNILLHVRDAWSLDSR